MGCLGGHENGQGARRAELLAEAAHMGEWACCCLRLAWPEALGLAGSARVGIRLEKLQEWAEIQGLAATEHAGSWARSAANKG